ncbi:MAG TPA: hypothetical protein VLI71_07845 [Gammaproteobacteria bacterium]|nr:hypothetical protein [Gammaproteobacteria bacterium]
MFLAQTAPPEPAPAALNLLTQLISALGPMGFVMWLVHRTTTHTIPRLAKSFEEALDRERADYKAALSEQRGDLLRLVEREHQVCDKLAAAVERMERGRP